ncbi:hypothetical protein [Nocardia terpenica]|uniref:Uncharacterized protein n=1 Tax=Nocardia terpenica TaxID=455432 RepID=A0A6G9Z5N8_9NOCA|nr:hypothetical protein [Nocardia terpenica]QIS20915.1 hypothetical protein F6W96_23955 [Nocardia terpenica]
MGSTRKHGVVPALVLVPAVAGYLVTGCASPTPAEPFVPVTKPATPTTGETTPQPPTTTPTPSPTPAPTTTDSFSTGDRPEEAEYAAVCANPLTGERLADTDCDDADETFVGDDNSAVRYAAAGVAAGTASAAMWYYLSTRNRTVAPPLGAHVSNGTYVTPTSNSPGRTPVIYRTGSVAADGGTVTSTSVKRGGLGSGDHSGRS